MPRLLPSVALFAAVFLAACSTPKTPPFDTAPIEVAQPKPKKKPATRVRSNPFGLPPYLQDQRVALTQGREISEKDLRAIADYGDGFAAWEYAERLKARADSAEVLTMLNYYALAAETGRAGGIPRLIQLTDFPEFAQAAPTQVARVETILRDYALNKGDTQAALFLIQRYNRGTPFGDKSGEVADLQRTLAESGDARVALSLATQILQGPKKDDPAQRAEARKYLETAQGAENISIKTTAQNLLALMDRRDGQEAPAPAQETEVANDVPVTDIVSTKETPVVPAAIDEGQTPVDEALILPSPAIPAEEEEVQE